MTEQVTIRKDEIVDYHDLIGLTNGFAVTIDGMDYGPGTVKFLGFRGAHVGDGLYRGVFAYSDADGTEKRIDNFPIAKELTDAKSSID